MSFFKKNYIYFLKLLWLLRLVFSIFAIFLYLCSPAQTYNFRHYTVEDGLLHEFINDIMQDSRGNVWIATGAGLSCFNGYEFTNYTAKDGFNYTRLQCVAEDAEKNIWTGSSKGLNVFDGSKILSYADSSAGLNILAIEPAPGGGMLILTDSGLCAVTLVKGKFRTDRLPVNLGQYKKSNIFQQRDLNNFILNSSNKGIFVGFSGHLFRISENKTTRILLPDSLLCFSACELRKHEILLGTSKGLFLLKDNVIIPLASGFLGKTSVLKIETRNNKVWIIARSNNETETWLGAIKLTNDDYFRRIEKKNGLINPPTSLFIDHENNVWCSSYGGLSILRGESFISYNKRNGMNAVKIWGVAGVSGNSVWAGSIGEGISVITGDSIIRNYGLKEGLPDLSVGKIFEIEPGTILLGTAKKGLCRAMDIGNSKYSFSQINCSINKGETRVDDIVRDSSGTIWVASSRGLYYSGDDDFYIHYPLFSDDTGQVFVQKILISSGGVLWVATKSYGVYRFENGKFIQFHPGFFRGVTVSSICEDCSHRIWVGSQTHGITDLSETAPHWVNVSNGLASNLVYILMADKHCNLWIGTNSGLDKLVLDDYLKKHVFDIRHYDVNDGLQSLEMNLNGAFTDENDNIWFATNNGLLKYNYLEDIINNIPPVSHITGVTIFSKPVDWKLYTDSVSVWDQLPVNPVLPYYQNHITFQFVGISYRNPKAIKYSWFMEGLDTKWTPANTGRSAVYTNLSPGNYVFRLRSSNNEGLWTEDDVSFSFTITPPFWSTWWFSLGSGIIIIIILYFAYRWRTNSLRRSKQELENQVKERTAEILKQKEKIESIHLVVDQSIEYAKQIQNSILPPDTVLKEGFDDHFVIYMPRDKVSGDFYWWTKMEADNVYVIAVADCTGHGVPGAFMSMLGITMLNEIVSKEYMYHPPVILRRLRKDIIKSLKQSDEFGEIKDGMDMAILAFYPDTMELHFAGANNPLILVCDDSNRYEENEGVRKLSAGNMHLYEFLPDKMPISIFDRMNKFRGHEIKVCKGDRLYIFSDGYADQFGGKNGKKFMHRAFKTLLAETSGKDFTEQRKLLIDSFNDWKGDLDQVDDVTILGIKL